MEPGTLGVFLSVLALAVMTVANEECPKNATTEQIIEVIECSGSCFEVVKPILDHFRELKTAADKSSELKNQLMEVKMKNELINEIIKSKDEQIKTLNALIKSNDEIIKLTKSEVYEKQNEIKNKDTLIYSLNKQIKEKNHELLGCLENINKSNYTLIEQEKKIDEKDHEIKEKTDQAQRKVSQIRDLTSQINVISQNLTKANEKLVKCDKSNYCPTAGKGTYHIKIPGVSVFEVPCNGSGWMMIQRRMDGSVNFDRNWTEYKDGFGNWTGEFFIGLEKLHLLTESRQHELHIRLGKVDGSTDFVNYDDFRVGSEKNSYSLESIGNSTGGAGDSLKTNKGMKFSTFDRDNDLDKLSCVASCGGGWWFRSCGHSSLNGRFYKDGKMKKKSYGIFWES